MGDIRELKPHTLLGGAREVHAARRGLLEVEILEIVHSCIEFVQLLHKYNISNSRAA